MTHSLFRNEVKEIAAVWCTVHMNNEIERKTGAKVIKPPDGMGLLEYCVVASLRAPQLMHGAVQRLDGEHKAIVMAQMEVAAGKVKPLPAFGEPHAPPSGIADKVHESTPMLEHAGMEQ